MLVAGWQSSRRTPKAFGLFFLAFFIMFMPHGDLGGLLSSLTSCFGERGGAWLWRNVMQGTLGEKSGLLPVGLQEATNRKLIIVNDNNVGDNEWRQRTLTKLSKLTSAFCSH